MYKCIDVSSNNGTLDWDKIKADGVECAIIRIGYGSDIESQDDGQAERNMSECERLGIPYGVYIYSYCLNMDQARSEATHTLRMIRGCHPVLGVFFDMEDADGYKTKNGLIPEQNGSLLTDFCIEFMQIIKDAGFKTGVYANWNYFNNILDDSKLTAFDGFNRWLAHWGIDEPSMDCLLWQYSSDGSVNGSSERTDMNWYYGELPKVEPTPQPEPAEQPCTKYKEGDFVEYDRIYASSTSDEALTPSAGFTSGTITRVIPGAVNPYLINNGTGWVNDGCINSASNDNQPSESDESIKVGDKVKVLLNVNYDNGKTFVLWHDLYDVIEIKGDRVVIGVDGTVTSAIDINNIKKA